MMNKNIQPNTDQKKTKRTYVSKRVIDEYVDFNGLRKKPVTEDFIYNLAKDIPQWFLNNKDSFYFEEYLVHRGILRKTFENWRRKFPVLQQAWEGVSMILTCRTYKGWLKKQFDGNAAKLGISFYNEEFKNAIQQDAKNSAPTQLFYNEGMRMVEQKDEK